MSKETTPKARKNKNNWRKLNKMVNLQYKSQTMVLSLLIYTCDINFLNEIK